MKRADATEAAPILDRMLAALVSFVPAKGRAGANARTAIGDTRANAYKLLIDDALGPPLDDCFQQALIAGITWQQIEAVRVQVDQETPVSLGAMLIQNTGVRLCLATECYILAGMTFISRQQVEEIKTALFQPFQDAEEIAADDMDQMTFQSLITLHGAITNHLVQTALPLPRMLNYQFFQVLPSLVMAYKLYDDASRADEVRDENRIVHPAFCPLVGEALSS
jgi:prophage DNA circulation protein